MSVATLTSLFLGTFIQWALIGFAIGLVLVVILRKRAIPVRNTWYKWLNRLYYGLIIGVLCCFCALFFTLGHAKGILLTELDHIFDAEKTRIDSLEVLLVGAEKVAGVAVNEATASLMKEKFFSWMGYIPTRYATEKAGGYIMDKLSSIAGVHDLLWIYKEWKDSKRPLSFAIQAWTHHKVNGYFMPLYIGLIVPCIILLLIPVVEIWVWHVRQRKKLERASTVNNSGKDVGENNNIGA